MKSSSPPSSPWSNEQHHMLIPLIQHPALRYNRVAHTHNSVHRRLQSLSIVRRDSMPWRASWLQWHRYLWYSHVPATANAQCTATRTANSPFRCAKPRMLQSQSTCEQCLSFAKSLPLSFSVTHLGWAASLLTFLCFLPTMQELRQSLPARSHLSHHQNGIVLVAGKPYQKISMHVGFAASLA